MEYKQQTADKIFEAAKRVFVERGFDGARTQRIADEGGVNKALLHYYFKTKEQLFEVTYKDSLDKLFDAIDALLVVNLPLEEQIDNFVDGLNAFCVENPLVPTFVFGELFGSQKNNIIEMVREVRIPEIFEGREELYYSTLSMILFPFIAMPFIMSNRDFTDYLIKHLEMSKRMIKSQLSGVDVDEMRRIEVELAEKMAMEKAARDAEKEAERLAKEAEKAARDAEKAAIKAAREAEKEAERLAKEAEKAEKEAERRKKLQEYNLFDDPAQYKLF